MFKKKMEVEDDEPFDPGTYVPEPTRHFDNAVDDMGKTFAVGGAIFAVGYGLIKAYGAGAFN